MKFYPVIIFCYNRPEYLSNLLSSIKKNKNYQKFKYLIFCDGPKNRDDIKDIKKISIILKKNSFIKKENIIYRKKNIGLAKNIIGGVSAVLNKYPATIVLEDDLQLGCNALTFVNYHLNKFKNDKKIGSISAYSYIHDLNLKNNFYSYSLKRHCSWCWGTWTDRWKPVKWNEDYKKHFKDKAYLEKFNSLGSDMNLMLWGHIKNLLNSWSIRFNYYCMKKSLLSIQPRYSLVLNKGAGKKGTNQKFSQNQKFDNLNKISKNKFNTNIFYSKIIDNYIKTKHKKSIRLTFYFFIDKIFNIFFK